MQLLKKSILSKGISINSKTGLLHSGGKPLHPVRLINTLRNSVLLRSDNDLKNLFVVLSTNTLAAPSAKIKLKVIFNSDGSVLVRPKKNLNNPKLFTQISAVSKLHADRKFHKTIEWFGRCVTQDYEYIERQNFRSVLLRKVCAHLAEQIGLGVTPEDALKAYFDVVKVNQGFNVESTTREFLVVPVTPKLSSAIMKELEKDLGKLALKYGLTVK